MALNPWSHDNPFTPGTLIRADEMNAALQGIAASLDEFATDLTNFVVRLPNNFAGENQIPDQTVTERLLYIDGAGNLDFYSLTEFNADVAQVAQDKTTTEGYKNTASMKAGEASSSATSASGSATIASNSAGAASGYASTANQHRLKARDWATKAENSEVEPGFYSAYHWAMQAARNVNGIDYNWPAIEGKPSSFPPSSHSHDVSQIDGLDSVIEATSSKGVYNNNNQTVARMGRVTEICVVNTAAVTKTLNNAAFTVGDSVRFYKTLINGALTVAVDSGNIQIPDNTLDSSHVLSKGAAVINLFKITSTTWALSIYGG